MFGRCVCGVRSNVGPLALTGVLVALVLLLYATDRRLALHEGVSTRYRFHAIPVAVSVVYHNRPHDYTAVRSLAMPFQNAERPIDQQVREAVRTPPAAGGTYFWVADDRGLADFTIAAFRLFGPKTLSLSKFYFMLLGFTVLAFAAGYWRAPAALLLPAFVLLGWLGVAQVLMIPLPFPNTQGVWAERIALYESRMFDVLALVAVLHLALLAAGPRANTETGVTAVGQAALLVFLYHARSSIGWQYLALFSLIAARVGWCVACRVRGSSTPRASVLRPLLVAGLLGGSLLGLKQYQRAAYHPDYLANHGQRTFWHNAIMGLAYHPGLRAELPLPGCEDRDAIDLVLKRMGEKNPALDRNQWNWQAALNSLGNHNPFDWDGYDAVARDIYFETWAERPAEMASCYGYHKPAEVANLALLTAKRVAVAAWAGRAWEFLAGVGLVLAAVVLVAARRDDTRSDSRSAAWVAAALIPFSLIPGIAFYPAITTVACFYLLSASLGGLLVVNWTSRLPRGNGGASPNREPIPKS